MRNEESRRRGLRRLPMRGTPPKRHLPTEGGESSRRQQMEKEMSVWKATLGERLTPRATLAVATAGALLLVAASILPVAADAPGGYSGWGAPTPVTAANTTAHDGCP